MIDVVLSGPGKNALSSALMQSLRGQLARAEGQPVLLRGEGDAFSAGLNFFELATLDAAGLDEFLAVLEDLLHELYNYPGPTVALVSGHAIAGGCLVAMCCDHRVCAADPRLKIGLNEVALGLHFPATALALARKRVNPQSLDEVILGARLYDPQDALRVGLVDEVAAAAEAVARQRLTELASHPADAYSAAKRAIRGGVLDVDPAQRRAEREALLPHWSDPALRARIGAFLAAKAQAKKG
ncbi:enoyl-CoA hydratase/isomerase family protein [Nannocystis punicea]|uniref:Enoyl-CoA hydratase/isomerase family protein n=1 Tax=Nannocystis punicea TaxID=2995304 RepID=A0ABY7H091_9BACT|nr:enoyl-CoA hydratase/isomerase family protein [Nannocystis poenicansa]WAS92661.1 enoyl-CoA hydratase/isomerase family protein [Nannocystis poenicansa]